jgi:hypothetical protein
MRDSFKENIVCKNDREREKESEKESEKEK